MLRTNSWMTDARYLCLHRHEKSKNACHKFGMTLSRCLFKLQKKKKVKEPILMLYFTLNAC